MISLEQSRKSFHEVRGLPVQNFWKTVFQAQGRDDILGTPKFQNYLNWTPNRSNCPELEVLMEDLTESIPEEWRARGRRIFTGRNLRGEANAEAWQSGEIGVIELNYGFTSAAMIYMVLYSKYFEMIHTLGTEVDFSDDDEEIIRMVLEEIEKGGFEPILIAEEERKTWTANGRVFPAHRLLREIPDSRSEESYHESVRAIEEFAIAHEYAHHLLGHTNDEYPRSRYINRKLDTEMAKLGVDLSSYDVNEAQVDELRADSLALLMTSGRLMDQVSAPSIYRSMAGAIIGLTVLAHINETWVVSNAPDETHPDFITRYEVATALLKEMSRSMPIGQEGGHPFGFLAQLSGFVSLILDRWLTSHDDGHSPANILGLASWLFERSAEIHEELNQLKAVPERK
ncbi:hypothetical protein ACFY0R_11765 [Streptomyces sp. NPDC001633]|uniref:hypothetical protein n=1 Tax=Streptomyces sp. NPDC001633 TaxID=3364595 RepID=UPI0036C629A7